MTDSMTGERDAVTTEPQTSRRTVLASLLAGIATAAALGVTGSITAPDAAKAEHTGTGTGTATATGTNTRDPGGPAHPPEPVPPATGPAPTPPSASPSATPPAHLWPGPASSRLPGGGCLPAPEQSAPRPAR